eukprot:CAMPEP_0182424262 /NCGR_PEP_ID=MMETSP1167-20130531/10438_1 /TAXON_ID=2988 /ORGANISM="Mallomonas Sp, Strain CCMP3275" /LENGTH=665 /DNA_ID=CAMNT_0024603925 /DNA_START=80 /DNA_END=2077 /DNA_ORIENTATION=-
MIPTYSLICFLGLLGFALTIPICTDDVRKGVDYDTLNAPPEFTVPFGKHFTARHFGVVLFMSKPFAWSVGSDDIPHLHGQVSLCVATGTSVSEDQISNACKVSVFGRIIGPEIHTISKRSGTLEGDHCIWDISFSQIQVPGKYTAELFTWWMNDIEWLPGERSARVNSYENEIVHLGGMGQFYTYNIVGLPLLHSLDGLLLKGSGRAIYMISNYTLCLVPDMTTLDNLGYDIGRDMHYVSDALLHSIPEGPMLQGVYAPKKWNIPVLTTALDFELNHFEENSQLLYGNDGMMNGSMVHGFPLILDLTQTVIDTKEKIPVHVSFSEGRVADSEVAGVTDDTKKLPFCKAGDNPGRWVRHAACDAYDQNHQGAPGVVPYEGTECSHSTSAFSAEVKYRTNSMVWRPYACRLSHLAICATKDAKCFEATGVKESDFDFPTNSYSQAETCMREKGIRFIAGFGDSVGEEQWKNVATLLHYPPTRFITGIHDHGLVCKGGRMQTNFHRLDHHELVHCIEASADMAMRKHAKAVLLPGASNSSTVVLVTNFMIIHMLYGTHTLEDIKALLHRQGRAHQDLATRLRTSHDITYRRIFFTGVARNGFKRLGLTPYRMESVNAIAIEVLKAYDFEILDGYSITYARPDGTHDGLSYDGGVSMAITDVLMTMLCS